MRALLCGLLLALLCALVGSQGHHGHHDSPNATEVKSTAVSPSEATKEPEPVCLTENRTTEDLKQQFLSLLDCHKPDQGNNLRPLVEDGNKTNARLEAIRTCFSDYVSNVSDCYSETVPAWNMTIKMLQEVEDYFCEDKADGKCLKLLAFYRGAGPECAKNTEAFACGENIMTTLLSGTYKEIVTQFAVLEYTAERCANESRVGSCVVEKFKNCQSDEPIGEIAEGLQRRIMAATCGASCIIHSSVSVWLVVASLFTAWRLLF